MTSSSAARASNRKVFLTLEITCNNMSQVSREVYNQTREQILRHSTKIIERIPQLDNTRTRTQAMTEIKREINTIKMYLGTIYPSCSRSVKKIIDELSNKGTLLVSLSTLSSFDRNRSAILAWASAVNDIRLDTNKFPWDFLPDVNINLSLIHIDTGPSIF